jgi:hypothetical protein
MAGINKLAETIEKQNEMKNIYLIIFLSFINFCFSQNLKELNLKSIDSIIFYDFDGDAKGEYSSIVNENGKLNQKIIAKSFKLNKTKFAEFNKILNQKESYGKVTAFCFDPHLGIVFFSKGIPLKYINICFGCNGLRANFRIIAQEQGKQGKGKNVYYILNGMSKKIRKYLNKLIAENNFGNQIKGKSSFD